MEWPNCASRALAMLKGTPSKLIAVVVVEDARQSWELAYNRRGRQVVVGAVLWKLRSMLG